MLQIRLSKQPAETGGSLKPSPAETVTVACPAHLVLADLPVAKGIGAATAATSFKTVGRRSRRVLGERVHFCVRCDFPIAIYGRLSPCDHAFCLDCARSDSICYICDEGIQKIQTIKMMEGIFICAAPHCLKSFLKREDFTSHIHASHSHLLQPNGAREDGNESDVQGAKPAALDVAARVPPRALISPGSNSQNFDGDEKVRRPLPLQRPMMPSKQPLFEQLPHFQTDSQLDGSRPSGFDRLVLPNQFQMQQESGQFPDKMPEVPNPDYPPMHAGQPSNFIMPMNPNSLMAPQFGIPPFNPDAGQGFYGSQYEMGQMARPDSAPEGAEQGSMLGFPPGLAVGMNFMGNYPHPWNAGAAQGGQVMGDGYGNMPDSHGNMPFYQGDYGRNPGVPPLAALHPGPPISGNKGMEIGPGSNSMDPRDGRGMSASQSFQHPPPPPQSSHASQSQRSRHFHGDRGHDGQGYGWQHENRDGFGNGQD